MSATTSCFTFSPGWVVHIDEPAIAAIGRYLRRVLPENGALLDLMSSWRSHLPDDFPKAKMVGLGLNAIEMSQNPQLDEWVAHNVNANPTLPFEDAAFGRRAGHGIGAIHDAARRAIRRGSASAPSGRGVSRQLFQPHVPHKGRSCLARPRRRAARPTHRLILRALGRVDGAHIRGHQSGRGRSLGPRYTWSRRGASSWGRAEAPGGRRYRGDHTPSVPSATTRGSSSPVASRRMMAEESPRGMSMVRPATTTYRLSGDHGPWE